MLGARSGMAVRGWASAGATGTMEVQHTIRTDVEIYFQEGLCDSWHTLLRWGLPVQLRRWWAPGRKPNSNFPMHVLRCWLPVWPWFFQKVNVQLGCILGRICILLWNRTWNKIIFIDKISQAIKTSCLLQQPCYKNKPCETSSPWYSALSQVLNGSYQTIGRHCSLQVLILTESFQSTDQQMEALTCERDRRTALAFLSWVQNKCCSHHTVGQMTSMLQLNIAHMVPFFWDTTACRRTEECYSTFIPRGTGNSKRPGLEGSPSKVALLCGRGPTSRPPVLHFSPYHSAIASQYSLLYV